MGKLFSASTIKEVLIATALIVVPLVLGYFAKAWDVDTEYYLPTIVIAWAVLLINSRIENKKILNEIQDDRKTYQSVLNQLISGTAENLRYLNLLTKYGATVKADANQMIALWHEACETLEGNYAATNYIDPKFQFGRLGQDALSMQCARQRYGYTTIQKIFIHDKKEEMNAWIKNEDERQEHIPFTQLRHIIVDDLAKELRNDFEGATSGEPARARAREMDFSIFKKFLLEWELDDKRQVTGGKLVWDAQKLEDRKALFRRMWSVAIDHNELSRALRNSKKSVN